MAPVEADVVVNLCEFDEMIFYVKLEQKTALTASNHHELKACKSYVLTTRK